MKKITLSIFLLLLINLAKADPGLWLISMLKGYPIDKMHQLGLKLSAQDIYSINHASLKDAVVQFGRGCTGVVISQYGLIMTNYHCAYSFIVNHSSQQHNYLKNGFVASSKNQELPNPGLTVTFLIYMQDVTNKVLKNIPKNITQKQRLFLINANIRKITDSVEKHWNFKYKAQIKPFFYGNQYILIVTQTFKDIRLVLAPPASIGNFGGQTDNWMWPRHAADFALFRIYANKNNQPASYSPDNIPYRPKKFVPISVKGYKPGDFTMIIGFPGYTYEYLPSFAIQNIQNIINPIRIKIRQQKLAVLNSAVQQYPQLQLTYAKTIQRLSNGWKKWIGQNRQLRILNVVKQKQLFEQKFQKWTDTSSIGKKYHNLLPLYKQTEQKLASLLKPYYYYLEVFYLTDQFKLPLTINKKLKNNCSASTYKNILNYINYFQQKHPPQIEKQILNNILKLYVENLPKQFIPKTLLQIYNKVKNSKDLNYGIGSYLYNHSILLNPELFKHKIKLISAHRSTKCNKYITNDVLTKITQQAQQILLNKILPQYTYLNYIVLDSLNRLYMKAQMLMLPNKHFYPDANLTMRVSFGTISGYKPKDAVYYYPFTTSAGIWEKYDSTNFDFNVPKKFLKLITQKNFKPYSDSSNTLHVDFIANNHTTGGNSGSPVFNANGYLIGLNFDRTWQTTMSDYWYDPKTCRNIMVDIRYILFVIDKYMHAKNIINEISIVN